MLYSREDRFHRVVVGLQDRIELVIVAARAADCEAEKGAAGRAHDIVQFIRPLLRSEHRVRRFHQVPRASDQETGRFISSESVAGNLLSHELIVRFVRVE